MTVYFPQLQYQWFLAGHGLFVGTMIVVSTIPAARSRGLIDLLYAQNLASLTHKSVPLLQKYVNVFLTGSSAALTLMMPYQLTDVAAPFPVAFAYRGLNWGKYVIAIGALFGIVTSLIGICKRGQTSYIVDNCHHIAAELCVRVCVCEVCVLENEPTCIMK